jgi:DNA-binding IclR family transcriptional regulator
MAAEVDACTPSAMIDRVALILDAFDDRGCLTLAQIVRRTNLPRSSAHRMLERLVQLRFLSRRGRHYELGMRLIELGHLAVHQDRLHRAAIPFLWDLHRVTGLVVHLAILDGTDVLYLDKVGDRLAAAVPSRIGGRYPAHCTSVGKAILAYSDQSSHAAFGSNPLSRKTNYSIANTAQLSDELSKVRARGYAFDREEVAPGFGCVAAPIGATNEAIAAVSICGPVNRMRFDHRLAAPVRTTAVRIWHNFDDSGVRPVLRKHPLYSKPTPPSIRPEDGTRWGTLQYA